MEQKYRARISLDFLMDSNENYLKKTKEQWKKWAERYAKQKTKEEKFLWKPSIFLNDDPEIHGKSFNYITISLYHSY